MKELNYEAEVLDFLLFEKGFPNSEIQMQAALGSGTSGNRYMVDLAIHDSKRNEIICLIEAKCSTDSRSLQLAVSQLMQSRRALDKPNTPLFLFSSPLKESGKKFQISQIL